MKKTRIIQIIIIFIAIGILYSTIKSNLKKSETYEEISYTTFMEYVEKGEVDTIYFNKSDKYMTFTLLNEDTKEMSLEERNNYTYKSKDYRKTLYPEYDDFKKDMLTYGVNIVEKTSDNKVDIFSIIIRFLPIMIFVFIVLFDIKMMKNMTSSSNNTNNVTEISNVKFSDVIGQDEIMKDIQFITELIKNPVKGSEIGVKIPKGILLSGPPGTGKTLIAKAIAGEAGIPFIYMNASKFIEMFVGVGAKRVRELFNNAKKKAPCIIFIDEIDSIGNSRDAGRSTNSEEIQTLNALLQEMDGFNNRDGIFVIAATNRPEKLDKALVRAGRFDRQIEVNPPKNWEIRKQLFNHYLKDLAVNDSVDIDNISKQTSGFTGADIAAICNEAGIIAIMKNKSSIDAECIEEAIDKRIFKGNRTSSNTYKPDKEIVAYHEAGHAVMTWLMKRPIARASIINSTSGVGGFVMQTDNDSMFTTKKELEDQILIAYAGRASEEIKFQSVTTGASNDITQATNIMLYYIERYGFDEDFGLLDMQILNERAVIKDDAITNRMSDMSKKAYKECLSLLREHYNKVELLANKLIEVETLTGPEIEKLLKE